ncbi:MAG TPA: cytochrome c oxidase subunit II [Thermoleophilaceae bacterium]|nr:cytochrome c oxidase subunit II [Thermoleophilaceae bacterium]
MGAAALLLALAPVASADWFSPESGGSPNANDIDTLYKIVMYIGIVIFFLVEGLLLYSVIRFRRRRRGPEPAMVHGNTPLEVGWTIGAALIVAIIAAITFIYLPRIKNPPNSSANGLQQFAGVDFASVEQPKPPNGKALRINVVGQQYIWRYDYIGAQRLTENRPVYAYYQMVVPTNTTVILQINSSDVAHSWWIPKLGGKADAIPGHNNYTWFKISKPGIYKGQCAELCGNNHADMLAEVRAVPPDQFTAWLTSQRQAILQSQQALAAQRKAGEGQ